MYSRIKVENTLEKRILTGLIVSKKFLEEIIPLIDLAYFNDTYIKRIVAWCVEYFNNFEDAPESEITNIYNTRVQQLKTEEAQIIENILIEISERHELEKSINVDYLISQTLEFFKKRELEIRNNNVKILLDKNDIARAEEEFLGFKKISRLTSTWVDPLDKEEIKQYFIEKDLGLMRLPGAAGELIGDLQPGWLMGITAPYKRGKTWIQQEFGVISMLSKIPVAFFSLEMTTNQMKERLYKRLVAASGDGGDFLYPVFDCVFNQDGTCDKTCRLNKTTLLDETGNPPPFSVDLKYQPCTVCRGTSDYECAIWYTFINRPAFDAGYVLKEMDSFNKMFNGLYRLKSYPRFSANITDINRDLNILEQTEGFVPRVIIIDYADILGPENQTNTSGVQKEDETWMALARLAAERHSLVITGTQATAAALTAKNVTNEHTARWKGKLGHIDVMLALNQTNEEKKVGIMRLSVMYNRHNQFDELAQVNILQQLNLGQSHLDSVF